MTRIPRIPAYLLAFLALVSGIAAGGRFPEALVPVADGTRAVLQLVILLVPLLILAAVSPAIATLVRRGLAGKFAAVVLAWFLFSSTLAALAGTLAGGMLFRIPLSSGQGDAPALAVRMLRELGTAGPSSFPVLAIGASVLIGLVGARMDPLYRVLGQIERLIGRLGSSLGYAMAPLILALGVMIGVTFGAQLGMSHYGTMILYALGMAIIWWFFYLFVLVRLLGGVRKPGRLLKEYYVPTALFAAGTSSSLATIPVNLAAMNRYGVREEVADFIIPLGAVVHKSASAMQYMAYAPFIAAYVFGLEISWSLMLLVWPFVVVYTAASPGVPGAMGLGLWTAVLFASLLGLEDPLRTTFVGTWVALASGIPDMFRTATNATSDGFTSVIFSHGFNRYFAGDGQSSYVEMPGKTSERGAAGVRGD